MNEFCTYRTIHQSGFFYYGKAKTDKVLSGKYKGSGIRWKLALLNPGFEFETWTTTIDQTFNTEDEAYEAEEKLVPIEILKNPYCLNMHAGGRRGRYATPSKLLKDQNSIKSKQNKQIQQKKKKEESNELKALRKKVKLLSKK